jgi:hypothetical protein
MTHEEIMAQMRAEHEQTMAMLDAYKKRQDDLLEEAKLTKDFSKVIANLDAMCKDLRKANSL